MMAGFLSALRRFGGGRENGAAADGAARVFADYLGDAARPQALDPQFDALLDRDLRWTIAPAGLLRRLPLSEEQREQYDFVAICEQVKHVYLLDSRPAWVPDIPFIPSFLLVAADEELTAIRPLGTFDRKPDRWTFAWQRDRNAGEERGS